MMMASTVPDMASMRLISAPILTWAISRSLLPLTPPRVTTISPSAARAAATGLGRRGRDGRSGARCAGVEVSAASATGDIATGNTGAAVSASVDSGLDGSGYSGKAGRLVSVCESALTALSVSATAAWLSSGRFCWRFLRRPSCAWREATRRAFPGIGYLLKRDSGGIGGRPNGHTVYTVDRLTIAVPVGKRQRVGMVLPGISVLG